MTQEAQKYAQHVRYQAILVLIEALDLESLLYMVYHNDSFRWIEMNPLYYWFVYLLCAMRVFVEIGETTRFSMFIFKAFCSVNFDQQVSFLSAVPLISCVLAKNQLLRISK